MTTPIALEPVRGSYPEPWILALPGTERGPLIPAPPIHHLFGLAAERGTEPGTSVFTMPCSPWLQSSAGVYTAGVYALVADAPFGGAIVSQLPPGSFGTTSELSMNFLRPADPSSGSLTARATLIDVGRSLGLSEAVVTDAAGRRLAHGTSRYVLRRLDPVPEPPADRAPQGVRSFDTPDPYLRPDPTGVIAPDELAQVDGLTLMRDAVAGERAPAPFAQLFGISIEQADPGAVRMRVVASEWLQSPARTIYGGVLAFLADAVMISAVTTTLPAGHSCATLDLKANYLRPGFADGRDLILRGEVVHRGRRIAVTRGEILNPDGKTLVLAAGSTRVLDRPWGSVAVADEPEDPDDAP